MNPRQATRAAREADGVLRERLIIDIGQPGILVVWEPSGEVRTIRTAESAEHERKAG